jgi:hypothetical protein
MSKKQVMTNYIRLSSGVTDHSAILNVTGTSSWWESSSTVAIDAYSDGLIHCCPELNSISKTFETKVRIVLKIITVYS